MLIIFSNKKFAFLLKPVKEMSYNIEENYTKSEMSKLHGKGRSKNIVSSYESGNAVNFYWRHVGC